MSMRKLVRKRLVSRAGESLAEVLVALMISALGLMMLAGMISSSSSLVMKSKDTMRDYIAAEAGMIEKKYENKKEGTFEISFKRIDEISGLKLKNNTNWNDGKRTVNLYVNNKTIQNKTIAFYERVISP